METLDSSGGAHNWSDIGSGEFPKKVEKTQSAKVEKTESVIDAAVMKSSGAVQEGYVRPDSIQGQSQAAQEADIVAIAEQANSDKQYSKSLTGVQTMIGLCQSAPKMTTAVNTMLKGTDNLSKIAAQSRGGIGAIGGVLNSVEPSLAPILGVTSHVLTGASMVVQLASLAPKSRELTHLKENIATKTDLLKTWEGVRATGTIPEGYSAQEVDDIINDLRMQVADSEEQKKKIITETALGLSVTGFMMGVDVVSTASVITSVVAPATKAAAAVGLASGVLGVASSGISVGLMGAAMVSDYKEIRSIREEKNDLAQLEEKPMPPAVAAVVELRLKCLDKANSEGNIKFAQHALAFFASGTGGVVGVTSIGLTLAALFAGVTVGAAASFLLVATGVGAAVLGAGLVAGGLGYAMFKKRKEIKISLNQLVVSVKTKAKLKSQRQLISEHASSGKSIEACNAKISAISRAFSSQQTRLFEQQQQSDAKINSILNDPTVSKEVKQKAVTAHSKAQKIRAKKLSAVEQHAISLTNAEVDKHTLLLAKINRVAAAIPKGAAEIEKLKLKKRNLQEEKMLVSLSNRFKAMTPEEVREIATVFQHEYARSPESKEQVKVFLRQQGFTDQAFDDDPVGVTFKYLVKAPKK